MKPILLGNWLGFLVSPAKFCVGLGAFIVCLSSVIGLHHLEEGVRPLSTFNLWCLLYYMVWLLVMLMLCCFLCATIFSTCMDNLDDVDLWSAQNYGVSSYVVAHVMAIPACLLSLAVCWDEGISNEFYIWIIPFSMGMGLLLFCVGSLARGGAMVCIVMQILFFQWLCMFGSDSDAAYFYAYVLPAFDYWWKWDKAWRLGNRCRCFALFVFPSVMAMFWWIRHYTLCLIVQQIFGCMFLLYIVGRSAQLIWLPRS